MIDVGIPHEVFWRRWIPGNFEYTRPNVAIATGVICVLFFVPIAIRLLMIRKENAASESRKVRFHSSYRGTTVVTKSTSRMTNVASQAYLIFLITNAVVLLYTLSITIYNWSVDIDPHGKRFPLDAEFSWNSEDPFDPMNWYCALYNIAAEAEGLILSRCHQGMSLQQNAASSTTLTRFIGKAVLDLIIVLPILQALLLGLHVWIRRAAMKTPDGVKHQQQLKDGEPDAYRMDDLAGLVQQSWPHKVQI